MSDSSQELINFFSQRNQVDLLYWVFAATVALVALFFLSRLVRNIFAHRARQIQEFGMDFDAVAKMMKTGLLSPEEAKRVKSVLARHFSQIYAGRQGVKTDEESGVPSRPQAAIAAAEPTPHQTAAAGSPKPTPPGAVSVTPAAQPAPPSAPPAAASSPEASPADEAGELPLDVLDMYHAGMITDDELEALRRFYAARARQAK